MAKIRRGQPDIFRKPKAAIRLFHRNEAGYGALAAVLVVMVLGAIILVPLLGFMITGQKAGNTVQERTSEFYSADAGVEKAIWWLQSFGMEDRSLWIDNKFFELPPEMTPPLNGDNLTVSIVNESDFRLFTVTSKATDIATGKTTTVVARIAPTEGFQGNFLGNAITSLGDVTIQNDESITGNVQCAGKFTVMPGGEIRGNVECGTIDNGGVIYGNLKYVSEAFHPGKGKGVVLNGTATQVENPPVLKWPEHCGMDAFYDDVAQTSRDRVGPTISNTGLYHGRTVINVNGDMPDLTTECIPPPPDSKNPGDASGSLKIDLSTEGAILTLDGNILVYGDLVVEGKQAELDLNGHTVYVRGELYIYPNAKITGAGLIIAIGNINAQPTLTAGGSKYAAAVAYYDGIWTTKDISETYLLDLNDVWGLSSGGDDTIYAVGNRCEMQMYSGPSNGSGSWGEVDIGAVPDKGRPNLNGVWGTNAGTFYAVGDNGTVVQCVGGTWSPMDSGTTSNLHAVWGGSDNSVYAVGDDASILHFDGFEWTTMTSGTMYDLYGVCGTSDNNVFAVGDAGTILRYDGSKWEESPIDPSVSPTPYLKAVWADSSGNLSVDPIAVGDGGTILHYNGVKWLAMNSNTDFNLHDVYGTPDGTVFAVGESVSPLGVQQPAVALKWTSIQGNDWLKMTMDPELMRDLNGVWGSSFKDVYAVGAAKSNFMFFMSVNGTIILKPDERGQLLGGIAGAGDVRLLSNQTLKPSENIGEPSFPRYRLMVVTSYVITMG